MTINGWIENKWKILIKFLCDFSDFLPRSNSLQIKQRCDIIFVMKRIIFAAISLCVAATAVAAPLSASAAVQPDYPEVFSETLDFENLNDFAVGGDNSYAFADGVNLYRLDGEIRTDFAFLTDVARVDYAQNGFYYMLSGDNSVYLLPEKPEDNPQKAETLPEGVFNQTPSDFRSGEYIYYFNTTTNAFTAQNTSTDDTHTFEGCANVKVYGGVIYAISGNSLHKIEGFEDSKITFTFSNYKLLESIAAGTSAQKMQDFGVYGENPVKVSVNAGSKITKINLNDLVTLDRTGKPISSSYYFPVKDGRSSTFDDEGGEALLLCEAGNVAVVARGTQCYILNGKNIVKEGGLDSSAEPERAVVSVTAEDWAHALPYLSNATRIFKIAPGDNIKVLAKLSAETNPQLAHDFYLVEKDGAKGFVAAQFLEMEYPPFNENDPTLIPDPEPQTDDYVKTVVLILVIVVIVLIAAGYVTWVCTAKKNDRENGPDPQNKNGKGRR